MDKEKYTYEDLLDIIARLRAKDGCPWNRAQTHESLKGCMLEEAYEGGARDFGENKVQEIQAKYGSLPDESDGA